MSRDLDRLESGVLRESLDGLELVPRPFRALAARLGSDEDEVIAAVGRLQSLGIVKRFGAVLRHRALGYRANAMVVWDVPDERASAAGHMLAGLPFVTLAYRRRRAADWPFNLYCMIHGRDRPTVRAQAREAAKVAGLSEFPQRILFSRRAFKQTGGRYVDQAARP